MINHVLIDGFLFIIAHPNQHHIVITIIIIIVIIINIILNKHNHSHDNFFVLIIYKQILHSKYRLKFIKNVNDYEHKLSTKLLTKNIITIMIDIC